MNPSAARLPLLSSALVVLLASALVAGAESPRKKNPTSKIFVADTEGDAEINTGEKIEPLTKKSVHNAEGTSIETKKDSSNAMVFSNGTGVFLEQDTRLDVKRFAQEPFKPNRSDAAVEPSISRTSATLSRGSVGLCTSKLVAGSTMNYAFSQGSVSIRGGKVAMETNDKQTTISLIEGDVTVRGGEMDGGGQLLKPGQQAIITPGPEGSPASITIQDIPPAQRPSLEKKVTMACMAKATVYFETANRQSVVGKNSAEAAADGSGSNSIFSEPSQEVVAVPLTPVTLPVSFTVSAARITQPSP